MLGDSAVLGTGEGGGGSGEYAVATIATAAAPTAAHDGANVSGVSVGVGGSDGGGGVSNSGDDERGRVEESDKSFGGNRWPRQETLALLKIRSDMDVAFRDASVKGPLWEEVSRKLAELGHHRNAKKCKEKFENVYKYHKRTKEGRSGKSVGKTYRFFDQLQALENNPTIRGIGMQSPTPTPTPTPLSSNPPPQKIPLQATPLSIVVTTPPSSIMPPIPPTTTMSLPQGSNDPIVPSTTTLPIPQDTLNIAPRSIPNTTPSSYPSSNPTTLFPTQKPNPTSKNNNNNNPSNTINPLSFPAIPGDLLSNLSSSSTSSEETTTEGGGTRRKRKRKWKDFFEKLMKEVMEKQEELQRKFLEAMEKREQEQLAREEAWRMQEMQRINREREILAQERSIAVAKDSAVMAFLQKIAQHQQQEINLEPSLNNNNNNITIAPKQPVPKATATTTATATPTPTPTPTPQQTQATTFPETPQAQPLVPQPQIQVKQQQMVTYVETNKADNNDENLVMGSASSSRWPKVEVEALINLRKNLDTKYQENGPKGPLWEEISALMKNMGYNRNAKRCKEKWENINKYFKKVKESNKHRPEDSKTCPYFHQLDALYKEKNKDEGQMKPENAVVPLMVQPEQQWPPRQNVVPPEVSMGDGQNDPMDQRHHKEDEDKEMRDESEDEDNEGGGNFEIVASKPSSANT